MSRTVDQKITWSNSQNLADTSLRGYLRSPYTFEETVARLVTLTGQPAESPDEYKVSVEFVGMFGDNVFALYDYKCDRELHIGGKVTLDASRLNDAIVALLATVEPTPYTAKEYYEGKTTHGWSA